MKKAILLAIPLIMFYSCNKEIIYKDTLPQLEIVVRNSSGSYISGAEVQLYHDPEDWNTGENMIQIEYTDSNGSALFKELEEKVYYFFVSDGAMDNSLGVSYFEYPLNMNEIKVIETIIQ